MFGVVTLLNPEQPIGNKAAFGLGQPHSEYCSGAKAASINIT